MIPGLGRYAGEGKGYPLQYSGLEKSVDCIACGVAKSWTQLNDFHFHFTFICRQCQYYFFLFNLDSSYFFSFSFFFGLVVVARTRTSNTVINKSGEGGLTCLVPDLRGNAFSFFTVEHDVGCGFVIWSLFVMLRCVASLYTWCRVFTINGC